MYHPSTIQTTSRFLLETGPQLKEGMSNLEKVVMTEIAICEKVWSLQLQCIHQDTIPTRTTHMCSYMFNVSEIARSHTISRSLFVSKDMHRWLTVDKWSTSTKRSRRRRQDVQKKRFLNNLVVITWRAAKYWSVYEKSFSLLVRYLPPVPIGNSVAQRARENLLSLRVAKTAWETRPQPLRSGFKKLRNSRLSTRSLPTRRAP